MVAGVEGPEYLDLLVSVHRNFGGTCGAFGPLVERKGCFISVNEEMNDRIRHYVGAGLSQKTGG